MQLVKSMTLASVALTYANYAHALNHHMNMLRGRFRMNNQWRTSTRKRTCSMKFHSVPSPKVLWYRRSSACVASLEYRENTSVPPVHLQEIANQFTKSKTVSQCVSQASEKFFVKSVTVTETALVTGIVDRRFHAVVIFFDIKSPAHLELLESATCKYNFKKSKKSSTIYWRWESGEPLRQEVINLSTQVKAVTVLQIKFPR